MLTRARRPVASVCIALLTLNLVGCTHIERKDPQTVTPPGAGEATMKEVVGVTLKNGRDIRFDERTRGTVRGDTVYAQVDGQPLSTPVSDVQRVWVRSVDGNRTTLMVIGLAAVLLVAFAAYAASQIQIAY